MTTTQQDQSIGHGHSDHAERDDAPPSAHVQRMALESFEPEAFVLRRPMPWADAAMAGRAFVAFGKSFDAFEARLRRTIGAEAGITDALFSVTRSVSGAHFWSPPMHQGRLDLRPLGL